MTDTWGTSRTSSPEQLLLVLWRAHSLTDRLRGLEMIQGDVGFLHSARSSEDMFNHPGTSKLEDVDHVESWSVAELPFSSSATHLMAARVQNAFAACPAGKDHGGNVELLETRT